MTGGMRAGGPERAWCDRCLTSAAWTFPITLDGCQVGTWYACQRCDPEAFWPIMDKVSPEDP